MLVKKPQDRPREDPLKIFLSYGDTEPKAKPTEKVKPTSTKTDRKDKIPKACDNAERP